MDDWLGCLYLFLILLALAILVALCQLTFRTVGAWILADIAGCGLLLLIKYVFQLHKFKLLKSHGTIAKIIKVDFDGGQLDWSLDEEQVKDYMKSGWVITFSFGIILAIGALILIPLYFYYNDSFRGLKVYGDSVSPEAGLAWSYVLSGIVLIITIVINAPIVIGGSIERRINDLVNEINLSLDKTEELHSLEGSMESLSKEIEISFPTNYTSKVQTYVEENIRELLDDSSKLDNFITKLTEKAKWDYTHLKEAIRLYEDVMQRYRDANREAQRSGNLSLIDYSNQLLAGLKGVKEYTSKKEWSKFKKSLDYLDNQIRVLSDNAKRVQEDTYTVEKDVQYYEPYEIMGVSPGASDEEVKRVWRRLVVDYHPDKVAPGTSDAVRKLAEEKFKEIKEAYECIMKERTEGRG